MATTLAPTREGLRDLNIPTQFKNEPSVDFTNPENARRMRAAIEKVRSELGHEYDLVIGGRHIKTTEKTTSLNPAKPSEIVGVHQAAGAAEVEPAMQAALKAFETWKYASVEERTGLLFRTSALMRERKFELMAWMVFEVGKNWAEADGDIAELIDFCDFYALEAIRLAKAEPPVQLPGERDWLRYIPLGVGVVIPPWNFPGAIMGGMTLASIVCGNTVIVKPSSDSPTIAAKFFEILEEAGLPDGVANFCPGHGNSFGNAIVEHPKTRYIAFTGSKEVGLHINQRAASSSPARSGSSALYWRWAAKTPSWWTPMPISTPRSKALQFQPSASADRNARPARAPLWTSASTTDSCSGYASAWRRSRLAIRRRTRTWAPWSMRNR